MKAQVIADAKILIPNNDHRNFTEGSEVIKQDEIVEGKRTNVKGLRRGQPFEYKLFLTDKNQLIYLNKIKPMDTTEVTLGADSKQSPTLVDMVKPENANKSKFYGAIIGAIAGWAYCKYKKHDTKKTAMYIGGGAVAGFVIGTYIDKGKNKVTIKPSK